MNKLNTPMAISQPNEQYQDDEIDLFALIGTLWRGKLWIVLTTFLAIFIGGYYAFEVATPLYPAKSVVALVTKQQQVVDIESVLSGAGGGSEELNTEVEVLRSRKLITTLVETLNLVGDQEFNAAIRAPKSFDPVAYLKTTIKELLKLPEVIEEKSETQIFNAVVDNVISVISVLNIRQSLVFTINVTTEGPEKSALIANTLAALYIQNSLNEKFAATEKASLWLSEKAAELKLELESSEIQLKSFSDGTQLISAEALGVLSIQLKGMRDHISDLDNKRSGLQTALESYEIALQADDAGVIVKLASDARLTRTAKQLKAGSISRSVFDAQARVVLIKIRLDLTRLSQQYGALLASEKTLKSKIDLQSNDLIQLQQLQREIQANTLLYESFLSRLKETAVQQGLQKPDSRLLSAAVPRLAASPKKGMIMVLSAMLGIMLGAGLILLRELRNNTFRTADDLEAYTGYGVLGSIPKAKAHKRKDILTYAREKPTSVFVEAIRNLRTSVLLSDVDNPPQVIMFTSSVPREGKTTQSLILAQNMAGLGKKVLVIEGDVRKRVFPEYFNIKGHLGFMEIMSGDATLEEAVFKPDDMGIDILIGNKSNVNAADIFASVKFADLIKMLRKHYDYIIIDTAPVLAVPDARVIGQHVDAILYSVLWNSTTKTQVKQGLAMFASVGLRVNGLVLSRVDSKEMKRYGYAGQYGYAYGDASGYHDN